MNKDSKKKIVLVGLFIFIIVIFTLIGIIKSRFKEDKPTDIDIMQKEIQLLEVMDVEDVYNIEKCVRRYLDGIDDNESIIKELEFNYNDIFYIKRAYILDVNTKNNIYFVEGDFISGNLQFLKENERKKNPIKLTLTVDNENKTFNISLYGSKYNDIINFEDNIKDSTLNGQFIAEINENIEYESFNYFDFDDISDEQLSKRFYDDFKMNALYFPEDAYKMIDDEYKKERFNTYESYRTYLQRFRDIIEESALSKYSINTSNGHREYTLVDTKQNSYILKTKESPMDYKIKLDNYTIKSEDYEEKYDDLNDKRKVTTNISIFMSMINTADYSHAYKLLDDNFKQNKFNNENGFKEYVNKNFFEYNIVSIKSIKKEGNYYICKLDLKNNNSSNSKKKELNIIMKLLEKTDFVMSFNIQ